MPNAAGSLPAPANAPSPASGSLGSAPGPAPSSSAGQTVVATIDLVGQGLSPLSDKDSQALLSVVNKTLAAHGDTVTGIRLGQVKVRACVLCTCNIVQPGYGASDDVT